MSIVDYINMLPNGDMLYGVPKVVPNPNYRVSPTERVPPLRDIQSRQRTARKR